MTGADFPGRIKNKLADRLHEKGFEISPWDLKVCRERVYGGDGIRWEGHGTSKGQRFRFHSFDTMTDCAKWGVTAHKPDGMDLEFSAAEPK